MTPEDNIKVPTSSDAGEASSSQAECKKELPQPPNDSPVPFLISKIVLAVAAIAGFILWLCGFFSDPAPKQKSDCDDLRKEKVAMVQYHDTAMASLQRSHDIAFELGRNTGKQEMLRKLFAAVQTNR